MQEDIGLNRIEQHKQNFKEVKIAAYLTIIFLILIFGILIFIEYKKTGNIESLIIFGLTLLCLIPCVISGVNYGAKLGLDAVKNAEEGNPQQLINIALKLTKYQSFEFGKHKGHFRRDEYGYRAGIFNKSYQKRYDTAVDNTLRRYLSADEFEQLIKENRIYDHMNSKSRYIREQIVNISNNAIKYTIIGLILSIILDILFTKGCLVVIYIFSCFIFYMMFWDNILLNIEQKIIQKEKGIIE